MSILSITLFVLGAIFLLLGWRWQNPPSEEAMTALKGLAYLKREISRVQDQVHVHVLEGNLPQTNQWEYQESAVKEEANPAIIQTSEKYLLETEQTEAGSKEKAKLYTLKAKEQSELSDGSESQRSILPKYQEVLKLAAQGQRIPEIAQRLNLSQDAVRMVLQMPAKGGAQ